MDHHGKVKGNMKSAQIMMIDCSAQGEEHMSLHLVCHAGVPAT